jgi:hypothetical protein
VERVRGISGLGGGLQVDRAFNVGILPAVQILSRKLLEDLVIDILRKKYGPPRLELYFGKGKRRFQGFELLLRNLSDNLGDFVGSPGLDLPLLKRVDTFREQGNSSAHSMELTLDPAIAKSELVELEHIAKVSIRVLQCNPSHRFVRGYVKPLLPDVKPA